MALTFSRMSQPYAGPGYGMHFPNHKGSDIVLAFEGGEVDRPVALGACPNPSNSSPVNSGNKTQSLIRTASGHQLCLDDKKREGKVELATAGGLTVRTKGDIDFNADGVFKVKAKEIKLKAAKGNAEVKALKGALVMIN